MFEEWLLISLICVIEHGLKQGPHSFKEKIDTREFSFTKYPQSFILNYSLKITIFYMSIEQFTKIQLIRHEGGMFVGGSPRTPTTLCFGINLMCFLNFI